MEKTYQEILKNGYDKMMKHVAWACEHFDGNRDNIPGTTADIKAWEKAKDELLATHPDSEWWEERARNADQIDLWWLRALLRQMTDNREIPFERLLDVAGYFFQGLRIMEKAYMRGDEKAGDEMAEEIEAGQQMLNVLGYYGGFTWWEDGEREWASRVKITVGRWELLVERARYEVDGEPMFHCCLYELFPGRFSLPHVIYYWDTRGWKA